MCPQEVAVKINNVQKGNACMTLPHFIIREIDACASLRGHPNVVTLLELFYHKQKQSQIYFVFEDMKGNDLRKFMKQEHANGMPVDMVINFARQLLEGLKHIHDSGFVHRDIKPPNILLGAKGSYQASHRIGFG